MHVPFKDDRSTCSEWLHNSDFDSIIIILYIIAVLTLKEQVCLMLHGIHEYNIIIESVDSISRDDPDMPYM